jgi:hypothetical protein
MLSYGYEEIDPVEPPEVAEALVKSTVPKSARGRTEHWVRKAQRRCSAFRDFLATVGPLAPRFSGPVRARSTGNA